MKALMLSEVVKLRTLRVTWIVGAAAVALSALIGVVVIRYTVTDPLPDGQHVTMGLLANAPVQVLWFLVVALCIVVKCR